MPELPPPVSLSQARERTIEALSGHFANDDLTIEELERRIESAYKATSVAQLDALTADLRAAVARPVALPAQTRSPSAMAVERERILAIMGETRRGGLWSVAQRVDLVALMSDTILDLTQAQLPSGVIDIHVNAMWSALKLIVPPGVHVVNRMSALMASVSSQGDESAAGEPDPRAPVIRLSGFALMAEVKVSIRRREEPA
jgi:DUF1707 SHOCT-like domain/Cell wall-active antibiotics response LiaF, C-terminal